MGYLKDEWRVWLTTVLVAALPYVYKVWRLPGGGWDWAWYVSHLEHTGYLEIAGIVEPLYFWLFKPLTLLLPATTVVNFSQVVMLAAMSLGVYLLSRRLGFNKLASVVAVLVVAYSPGTARLLSDTLRNFLSYSLVPWFIYLYTGSGKERWASFGVALLMVLSHRMVLVLVPVVAAYEIVYRRLRVTEVLVVAVGLVAVFLLGFNDAWHILHIPLQLVTRLLGEGLHGVVDLIVDNALSLLRWAAIGTLMILVSDIKALNLSKRSHTFLYLHFMLFLTGSLLFHEFTAGRLALYYVLPMGLLAGLSYQTILDAGCKKRLFVFHALLVILVGGVLVNAHTARPTVSQGEMDFIESLDRDVPEDALLVVPSRVNTYTKYVWHGYYRIRMADYYDVKRGTTNRNNHSLVYRGVNPFNETIWFLDGGHWTWDTEQGVVLKRMSPNGSAVGIRGLRT